MSEDEERHGLDDLVRYASESEDGLDWYSICECGWESDDCASREDARSEHAEHAA